MKKLFSLVLVGFMIVFATGCNANSEQQKAEEQVQNYYDKVEKLVKDKGYTMEEISALKAGQEVDKDYDNEVLERFGKVQGYAYKMTHKWNDGLNEGPFTDKSTKYSTLTLDEMKKEYKDSYDDSKHFDKYTITLSKRIILDAYYQNSNEDNSLERHWQYDDENWGTCPTYLPDEEKNMLEYESDLKTAITQTTDAGTQLKIPTITKE